ncbi:hypothetical protein GGR04_004435 [Aureimonas pseudogalii]|uniref:Uncharacterized protein n=1 Tax=Aureimonas pseudogalii TaxID=1744844 RepID=A0A7W6MM69_9HYPH|nr:hypothetical protein [Aureimonas pseudogalii]
MSGDRLSDLQRRAEHRVLDTLPDERFGLGAWR